MRWIPSRVAELMGWAISRYSPSNALRLGMAMNNPFSPSITLMSITIDDEFVVHELIIDGDRHHCFHLPLFCYLSYPNICYIHSSSAPFGSYHISFILFHNDLDTIFSIMVGIRTYGIPALHDTVLDVGIVA